MQRSLTLLSIMVCLKKIWRVQFQVTHLVHVAGNLTVDSQKKKETEKRRGMCMLRNNTFLVWEHHKVHTFFTSSRLLYFT